MKFKSLILLLALLLALCLSVCSCKAPEPTDPNVPPEIPPVVTPEGGENGGGESKPPVTVCPPHDYEEEGVAPTATMTGYSYKKCKICGSEKTEILEPTEEYKGIPEDLTPTSYALMAAKQALSCAEALFEQVEKSEKQALYSLPYSGISEYLIIRDFALELTEGCATEREKAQAIFNWIATNIEYDLSYTNASVYKTFTDKKAVCFGYTVLMHDMLSGVGIMSAYTSGLASSFTANHFVLGDFFNEISAPDYARHAWITVWADGEAIFCDPTWSDYFESFDNGFDIPAEELGKTHVALNLNAISIVPDGVDIRAYTDTFARLGDRIFHLHYGELGNTAPASVIQNSIEYSLVSLTESKVSTHGIPDALLTDGFYLETEQEYYHGDVAYWSYALPDGRSYDYTVILTYVLSLKHYLGQDISLERIEEFPLKDGLFYRVENGVLTLLGSVGKSTEITVPSEANGLPVKIIGVSAFQENHLIEKVTVEDGVEVIRSNAFWEATSLKELKLPSTLKVIEQGAIAFTALNEINIPEGVEIIGGFSHNEKLKKFNIPSSATEIKINNLASLEQIILAEGAPFKLVDGVLLSEDGKKVILYPSGDKREIYALPEGVEAINNSAFSLARNLKSVTLPSSLKTIGEMAFDGCSSIEEITVPEGVTAVEAYAFNLCEGLKKAVILAEIEDLSSVFYQCLALEEVVLPSAVSNLNWTFFNCQCLKTISFTGESRHFKLVEGVLYSKDGKTLVLYPAGKEGSVYTVKEGTEALGAYAFCATKLETIIFPEGFKRIDAIRLSFNDKLKYIVLPSTLTKLFELPFPVGYTHAVYLNMEKEDKPSEVNLPSSATVYWKGEWKIENGLPVPLKAE